jgi:WD40 repeat protein
MDWSRVVEGRLATADCHGMIHIWNAMHPVSVGDGASKPLPWGNSSFEIKPTYSPNGDNIDNPSVEDLQWSPNEATVLASAECGGYVRIYDIRCPNRAMISNKIHKSGADVNVISWNRLVSNLLASGGDDGTSFCMSKVLCLILEFTIDILQFCIIGLCISRILLRMGPSKLPNPRQVNLTQASGPIPLSPNSNYLA